jgi:hypothetical protein
VRIDLGGVGNNVPNTTNGYCGSIGRPYIEGSSRPSGALDQSNLARFLLPQMSAETTRKLAVAAQAAGFFGPIRPIGGVLDMLQVLGVLCKSRDPMIL